LERVKEEGEEQMVKQEAEEKEEKSATRKTEDSRARELADISLIRGRQSMLALPKAIVVHRQAIPSSHALESKKNSQTIELIASAAT
jgi:hypothetical protein